MMHKPSSVLFLLVLLSFASFIFALSVGSLSIPLNEILLALKGGGSDITRTVIFEGRDVRRTWGSSTIVQ